MNDDRRPEDLRDWFAGLAMQSLIRIGAEPIKKDEDGNDDPDQAWYFGNEDWEWMAANAYSISDAMLKAREDKKTDE